MKRTISLAFILVFIFSTFLFSAEYDDKVVNELLDTAENFFISLKDGDYKTVWSLLSDKSHRQIVDDVHKASNKIIKKEDIHTYLSQNSLASRNYWNSFVRVFDPDAVLKDSTWSIGMIKKKEAEIIISHKKSERPAKLKMLKENGIWKVGMVETFWKRKL